MALTGYQALMVVFLIRVVGVGAGTVGLLLALISCGGASERSSATRWPDASAPGRALLLTKVSACPCALLIPLAAHGWRELLAALGGLGVGLGIVAGNVISSSFTQAYTPASWFARSNATINVFNYGMMPLGRCSAASSPRSSGSRPRCGPRPACCR